MLLLMVLIFEGSREMSVGWLVGWLVVVRVSEGWLTGSPFVRWVSQGRILSTVDKMRRAIG
jgi:hypothetical protein